MYLLYHRLCPHKSTEQLYSIYLLFQNKAQFQLQVSIPASPLINDITWEHHAPLDKLLLSLRLELQQYL